VSVPPFILIEDSRAGGHALGFSNPAAIIAARSLDEVRPALAALDHATRTQGLHAAGFIAYEAGFAFEPRLSHLPVGDGPLLWFGLFEAPVPLTETDMAGWGEGAVAGFTLDRGPDAFSTEIAAIHDYLRAGDVYQINHTLRGHFGWTGSPRGLYAAIRPGQRVGHGALIETGDFSVLSWSPELFLERRGISLTTRPMKGTAARGRTLAEDAQAAAALFEDEKCRAENLMIVDLLRNDLGRIADPGSVRVDQLFGVEQYLRFNTLTSTIRATIAPDLGVSEIMPALFPCGSVTGAPKIRAMELIADLEARPRGVYTGAIGHIRPGGDFSFNVAIRTATLTPDGKGVLGVGAGIVADSDAQAEYQETKLKARFLTAPVPDFELFETTLYDPGHGFMLLDRHLDRLENSARYFNFAFDRQAVHGLLQPLAGDEALRVRFALRYDGSLDLVTRPLCDEDRPSSGQIGWATDPVSSTDPFVFHKTSHRSIYNQAMADAKATGLLDLIFINEKGEVTEGARTNMFVQDGKALLTPALDCGLLPGTMRAELLKTGQAREAVLSKHDVETASQLMIGNSVMGLVPVTLKP